MRFLSYYWLRAPWILVYMLQQVEYSPSKFADWVDNMPDLNQVMKRQKLILTSRTKLMLLLAYVTWLLPLAGGIAVVIITQYYWSLLISLFAPLFCVFALFFSSLLLQLLIVQPLQRREITAAIQKLSSMDTTKIAVLGSYGKTSMKELLLNILEGVEVAATPGNKNVLVSHARWVNRSLSGSEKVLVFEYGEGEPGDIKKLMSLSQPDMAVITGLAPAHLDQYQNTGEIVKDFAAIKTRVPPDKIYVNATSDDLAKAFEGAHIYGGDGVDTQKVTNIKLHFGGMSFTLKDGKRSLNITTKLLGKHHIGPICAAIAIARALGVDDDTIQNNLRDIAPYQHRMQPRALHGAWIIDDTYNGNIEGMRAGLELLAELPAKKRIYVTPGLVDQGSETENVHHELGRLIAHAQPDKVVLMKNSVTAHIEVGLQEAGFGGELVVETNPLEYYTNLEHYLAAGDVVLLQNDWPDSYF